MLEFAQIFKVRMSAVRVSNQYYSDELRVRWLTLCRNLGVKGDSVYHLKLFNIIAHYYTNPLRRYHGLQHIYYCLKKFDEVKDTVRHPLAVELAIFLHDMNLDPWSKINEKMSADGAGYFIIVLMGLTPGFAIIVGYCIECTDHDGCRDVVNEQAEVTMDIDLANLGDTWEVFHENLVLILEEINTGDLEEAKSKARRSLQSFRWRNRIYLTGYFHEKYEARARENLERAILELKAKATV